MVAEMGQCKKLAIELNLYEEGKDLKEVLNHKEMHKAILNNFLESFMIPVLVLVYFKSFPGIIYDNCPCPCSF